MKMQKQIDAIKCIETGYYKVIAGQIYSRRHGEYKPMKCCPLPNGYTQVVISNHKRADKHISVRVYKHVFIYLFTYGIYQEGHEIDHIDRDKSNTLPNNLRAVSNRVNISNSIGHAAGGCELPIRGLEIDNIRELMEAGHSQSEIAQQLNLNRLSVRYTCNNIKLGKRLKFDGVY